MAPAASDIEEQVPTIDIGDLLGDKRSAVLLQIAQACAEWGCFQVVHHGVPQSVIENMWAAAHRFHEQPGGLKESTMSQEKVKGINFMSNEITDPSNWLEILIIRRRPGVCNGFEEASEIFGESLRNFGRNVENLGNKLYTAIFESLGLEQDYCKAALPSIERVVLTLNFYPPCPHPDHSKGFKEHTDVGTLTLLLQDQVGGLQAQSIKTGNWVTLEYRPDVFVVILADQAEILSNGKYKSCMHRVLVNRSKLRISMPFAFGPREEDFIEPLPKLLEDKSPRVFKGAVFKDYMARYFDDNSHKALDFAKGAVAPIST